MKRSSQWLMLLAAACACKGGDNKAGSAPAVSEQAPMMEPAQATMYLSGEAEEEANKEARAGLELDDRIENRPVPASGKLDASRARKGGADEDQAGGGGGSESAAPTRAWFPETFLFEPLIETDDSGAASLSVRVPDRLTTWRVLGLAHSRDGAQAGAVTSFLGTLPVYIEPVVPAFLRAGDQVNLPVQVVNTTAEPVTSQLAFEVAGAELVGPATSTLTLAANASAVRYVTLRADRPGNARLLARLGNADSTVREIPVYPSLKPVTSTQRGTLALPRTVKLTLPAGANPGLGSAHLSVYPGALAMLRAEMAAAPGRTGDVADDAFALLLAGTAPSILRSLGDQPKEDETATLRSMTIVASQRAVRHARVLRNDTAALIAEAALAHGDANPILGRIGQRAIAHIESNQSPDGTCGGEDGWTLQRLLVATAECVRAAKTSPSVTIRAAGAFERHAERIQDPYTAAAILASGASISEPLAQRLRKLIRDAIKDRDDGAKIIDVPADVVRADGRRPSGIEATAWAVLALAGDADAPRADLGAAVLSGYIPGYGWGDGRASLVAMQAVIALFSEPLPGEIRVTLSMNGQPVAEGMLSRERSREVMMLEAAALPGAAAAAASAEQTWEIRAEPPLAGLGYALSLTSYVPWPKANEGSGMALDVAVPQNLRVGQVAELAVRATAPSGQPFRIRLTLPAGVQVDTDTLDRLTAEGILMRYEQSDESLDLHAAPLAPAQLFSASVRVIPTLSGELQSGPATLSINTGAGDIETIEPPVRWPVR